jgi:hypothetical protein
MGLRQQYVCQRGSIRPHLSVGDYVPDLIATYAGQTIFVEAERDTFKQPEERQKKWRKAVDGVGTAGLAIHAPYSADPLTATLLDGPAATSNPFTVVYAPVAAFAFNAIPDQIVGALFTLTLTARDAQSFFVPLSQQSVLVYKPGRRRREPPPTRLLNGLVITGARPEAGRSHI